MNKGIKEEVKEARMLFLPFYLFTFLPLKIMPNDQKAYAQREKAYMQGKLFPQIKVGMTKVNLTPTVVKDERGIPTLICGKSFPCIYAFSLWA